MATKSYRGNSASRRQIKDRQDNNLAKIVGVSIGLIFVSVLFFGGESADVDQVVGPEVAPASESNPITDYASGAKTKAMLQELEQ